MFLEHNPISFLSGDNPFLPAKQVDASTHRVDHEVVFESKHEGFIGIPHGGLAMGSCIDAWRRTPSAGYPAQVKFKFGGTGIKIGDEALLSVERAPNGDSPSVVVQITKNGDKTPYIRAEVVRLAQSALDIPLLESPSRESRELPYYRNCFVCGHHRDEPGLERRFRVHPPETGNVVTTDWSAGSDDKDRAGMFLFGSEELHPAVPISIFDENTGWSGFMLTRACGLSVRTSLTLLRPVGRHEPLLFVSRPVRTRGNPTAPRFFIAEGAVLSTADPANPEPVAFGEGEWIVMREYTDQAKANLLPEDDWQWIFPDDK
jgi:hypothetical protein